MHPDSNLLGPPAFFLRLLKIKSLTEFCRNSRRNFLNLQINNSFIQIDRLKHFDVLIIICLHSTTIEISSVYHKALTIILTEDTN